ncbi:MAG: N-6 DNA methylase [Alphaproteobacteria bacterium]|nr:N-6 DNA methylase [Alphaproteobacteria bacterium]
MAVEEHVKGIMTDKFVNTEGYPSRQDKSSKEGVTWYKEGSYQKLNPTIAALLQNASKSMNGNYAGTPDFMVDTPKFYIVIEAKGIEKNNKHKHSRYADVHTYINRDATRNDAVYSVSAVQNRECAIDEALYYATFLNGEKDVIAIAISGTEKDEKFRFTSFLLPKGENLSKITLIEDGGIDGTFNTVEDYQREIWKAYGFEEKLYRSLYEELRKYADSTAKFLNTNGIDENDRLGLVSAIILALTNKNSYLYAQMSKKDFLEVNPELIKSALLSEASPIGIIIEDRLPPEKFNILKTYFDALLVKPILINRIKIKDDKEVNANPYFEVGKPFINTIISRLTYSLNEHVVRLYEKYQNKIDIMGSFYSLFLQYTKADVKKGVVLTPKHITELFCDLAEYYLGEKLSEKTKILDICTGSGGFLIAALNRININIDNNLALSLKQKDECKEKARKTCLLGIENKDTMFILAYANMRFHKDGRSSLYHGSSLYNDFCKLANNLTFEEIIASQYTGTEDISNAEKVKLCGPHVGMINPPYEEDVFEFIESMLRYLRKGGIGIAIVPINTQSTNNEVTEKKNQLLEKHTLLASILMPPDLFNGVRGSGAATSTCILVFKSHYPQKEFIENGGLTYIADWSNDGFKLVPKHGRFEQDNRWYDIENGYRKLYLNDLKHQREEQNYILSSYYKKDIHDIHSIKSIRKPIHKFSHEEEKIKTDKKGNIIYKTDIIQRRDKDGNLLFKKDGKPCNTKIIIKDELGNPIPEKDTKEIYINEDWNILDYVKTDYNELSEDDFIKTMLDYNLFLYMKENNLLFVTEEES